MKNERLADILNRVMTEQASEAEHKEMLDLIADPDNEQEVKQQLFEAYQNAGDLTDVVPETRQQILQAIFESDRELKTTKPGNNFGSMSRWIAAAVAVILLSIGIYWVTSTQLTNKPKLAREKQEVLPGGNRATLTLANGSVISLTEVNQGKIATEAGLTITKLADGRLVYRPIPGSEEDSKGYNTISTPFGGKYEIIFQDGTRVLLNSGSKITYPLVFNDKQRKVTLTGEAYFEVSKDPHRPFIVNTPAVNGIQGQDIEVLGTQFNINAYADEYSYVTTLVEGRVKVATGKTMQEGLLKPGQQSIVRQSLEIRAANLDAALAWKNNLFYFSDLPVKDIMRQLVRWYDIEVIYDEDVPSIGFWGQISRNKKLSEVLESIEETNGVHFRIEGRKVFVTK